MSFFNKVSNIWKSMGFKESDKMVHLKEMYERSCAREKSLESDLVDHSGCINYLNTLIDLLNKSPKMIEAYKLYLESKDKQTTKDTGHLFMSTQDMIKDLTALRNEIAETKSTTFNKALKNNLVDKEEGNSSETN